MLSFSQVVIMRNRKSCKDFRTLNSNIMQILTFNHQEKASEQADKDFLRYFCTTYDGALLKKSRMLSFSLVKIFAKQKQSSNHFYYTGTQHHHVGCSFWLWKNHQNKSVGISLWSFCRTFQGVSFQNTRFYHLPNPGYMENKKSRKPFGTFDMQNISKVRL